MSQSEPPPQPGPSQPPEPHWTFISVALFVIGLLILIPSGICTGLFGIGALSGGGAELFGMAATIGGPFIALGVVLIIAGLNTRRHD